MAYNGWKTYETWNVALWLGNDEGLYRLMLEVARAGGRYRDLVAALDELGITRTGDHVSYRDRRLSLRELNSMMKEAAQ